MGGDSASGHFVYDSATVNGVAMQNAAGRLVEAYTGSHATDEGFSYTVLGQVSDFYESPSAGNWYHTAETFYPNGAPQSLSIPGVPAISYGVDGEGNPTAVNDGSGYPVTSATYTLGRLTALAFPNGDGDSWSYDPDTGRMTQYQFEVGGNTDTGTLEWNQNGSAKSLVINDGIPGTSDSDTCNFSHDDLGLRC